MYSADWFVPDNRPLQPDEINLDAYFSQNEKDVLALHAGGHGKAKIAWLLDLSLYEVTDCMSSLSDKIHTDDLLAAGVLFSARQSQLESRQARLLANSLIRPIVGARILKALVDESHAGFEVMLANGEKMQVWVCSDEQEERPGWLSVEMSDEPGQIVHDGLCDLIESVEQALGGKVSDTAVLRDYLADIAEKAIDLLDDLDGDCDEEPGNELEDDSLDHNDFSPLTLNPLYLNPEFLLNVIRGDAFEAGETVERQDDFDGQAANVESRDDHSAAMLTPKANEEYLLSNSGPSSEMLSDQSKAPPEDPVLANFDQRERDLSNVSKEVRGFFKVCLDFERAAYVSSHAASHPVVAVLRAKSPL